MKVYGLIGYPLEHSFSKDFFTAKFDKENITDCEYRNFQLSSIEQFQTLVNTEKNLCGLNVTIPYKISVIDYLDGLSAEATDIGAVNCIKITNGKRIGCNTDCFGFENSLRPLLEEQHTHALILGSGGSAKAVSYVLNKLKIGFTVVSSSRKENTIGYEDLTEDVMKNHLLIINTTPVGMFPAINDSPEIPFQFITGEHFLYDLIYNPGETLFMKKGKLKGAKTKNGLQMLQLQAEESWRIWNK